MSEIVTQVFSFLISGHSVVLNNYFLWQILEGILGRDTIESKGIGTDNMTLIIVKFSTASTPSNG